MSLSLSISVFFIPPSLRLSVSLLLSSPNSWFIHGFCSVQESRVNPLVTAF